MPQTLTSHLTSRVSNLDAAVAAVVSRE